MAHQNRIFFVSEFGPLLEKWWAKSIFLGYPGCLALLPGMSLFTNFTGLNPQGPGSDFKVDGERSISRFSPILFPALYYCFSTIFCRVLAKAWGGPQVFVDSAKMAVFATDESMLAVQT